MQNAVIGYSAGIVVVNYIIKNMKKGFTIIELLVVIALIGIITTIAYIKISGKTFKDDRSCEEKFDSCRSWCSFSERTADCVARCEIRRDSCKK